MFWNGLENKFNTLKITLVSQMAKVVFFDLKPSNL